MDLKLVQIGFLDQSTVCIGEHDSIKFFRVSDLILLVRLSSSSSVLLRVMSKIFSKPILFAILLSFNLF